jgi:hypothetical protein
MSLQSTELLATPDNSAGVSSLYNLGTDPTENTAYNNPSIVVMGRCLTIDWISFLREHLYRPLFRNDCFFIRCTRQIRGLCPATGIYATIFKFTG